jgi:hypothetical protein
VKESALFEKFRVTRDSFNIISVILLKFNFKSGVRNSLVHSRLLGFWTFSFIWHTKKHKRTYGFGNWICFHSQVRGRKHCGSAIKTNLNDDRNPLILNVTQNCWNPLGIYMVHTEYLIVIDTFQKLSVADVDDL